MGGMDGLKKAQALLRRLHKRELYKCCGYLLLSPDVVAMHNPMDKDNDKDEKENGAKVDHPKIAYHAIERNWALKMFQMFQERHGNQEENMKLHPLTSDDLRMQLMSLSFGKETEHPMSKAMLYSSNDPNTGTQFEVEQISTLGGAFREVVVRAYVKKSEWKRECEEGFKAFAKKKNLIQDTGGKSNVFTSLVVSPPQKRKLRGQQHKQENEEMMVLSDGDRDGKNNVVVRKRRRPSTTTMSA